MYNTEHRLTSPNATQTITQPLDEISFEHIDVLFVGLLAKAYSDGYYQAPMQRWAGTIPPRDLDINGHVIRMTDGRRRIDGREVGGVAITINYNFNAPGEKSQEHFFIPFSELADVKLTVRGLRE